jgi:hypothetical protein
VAGDSSPAVHVEGFVRDAAGAPIGEVRVRLVDASGRTDPVAATTGPDGRFGFDALPAGGWGVQVRGVGRLPIRARLDVERDTTLGVILVQQPATYVPTPLDLQPPEEPVVPPAYRPAPRPTPAPQPEVRTAK